jgi:capsular polysaccharide biosynthesis protein
MVVSGRSENRTTAQRLANSEAGSISSFADREQQQLNVPQAERYRLTVIQPANATTTTKVQPQLSRALKLGGYAGVAAAVLAYVILQLLTTESRLD